MPRGGCAERELPRDSLTAVIPRVGMGVVFACLALLGCADDDEDSAKSEQGNAPQLLLVHNADSADLDLKKGTLVLSDPSPVITFFSDRPERIAGSVPFEVVAANWRDAFGEDPPNATIDSLEGPSGTGPAEDIPVTLLGPPEASGRHVTYRLTALGDTPTRTRSALGPTSLFIDGFNSIYIPGTHFDPTHGL